MKVVRLLAPVALMVAALAGPLAGSSGALAAGSYCHASQAGEVDLANGTVCNANGVWVRI